MMMTMVMSMKMVCDFTMRLSSCGYVRHTECAFSDAIHYCFMHMHEFVQPITAFAYAADMLMSCDYSACACSDNCAASARRWLVSLWRACQRSLYVSTVACLPVASECPWNMQKLRNYSALWRNLLTQLNESPSIVSVSYDTDAWHDALYIEIRDCFV